MDGIMKYINRTTRCSNFYRTQQLQDTGISGVQCVYLMRISRQPGISQDQLAGQLYKDKSVVARQLATLQQEGFVRKEPSPTDRRVQQLYPTDKTLELLPRIRAVLDQWNVVLTRGFSDEEQKQALALLQRMYENAENELHRNGENPKEKGEGTP